jgi:hypothetical protein
MKIQADASYARELSIAPDPEFARKPGIAALRLLFGGLSSVAPQLAARLGLRLFLTPARYKASQREISLRERAKQSRIPVDGKAIAVYSWGSGPHVLLSHSWGGRATQLRSFVEPLVSAGYCAVAFDGPAHGLSTGRRTNMIEFARTITAVAEHHRPLHALIGHSFGAATALLAMRDHQLKVDKLALLGCIAHGVWVIDTFGSLLGIRADIVLSMRELLEKQCHPYLKWDSLAVSEMAATCGASLLLVHDLEDKEVPYEHLQVIHSRAPSAAVMTTRGNGHRRIVHDSKVVQRVVEFVSSGRAHVLSTQ